MKISKAAIAVSANTISKKTVAASGIMGEKDVDPKLDQLLAITHSKGTNINDAQTIFEILPDIAYASDLIVSETLSPQDLLMPEVNFEVDYTGTKIDPEKSDAVDMLKKHFSEGGVYDIESKLYKYLEESYITAGAVCLLTLPKNEIDNIVQASAKKGSGGKVGTYSSDSFSFESAKAEVNKHLETDGLLFKQSDASELNLLNIEVTDNANCVKERIIEDLKIQDKLRSLNMESAKPNTLSFLDEDSLIANSQGHGLVIKWPTESCIPVYTPGNPEKHVGYWLVTEDGYPLTHKKDSSEIAKFERNVKKLLKGSNDSFKNVISVSSSDKNKEDKLTSKDYVNMYTTKVKQQLARGLKNGLLGSELTVSDHDDAYSLMLYRALNNKKVKMIYVPAGMIDYFAFDYDSRGIGRSAIEKTKLFSSIRIAMLIADIFASIRNSIPTLNASMTIEEEDQDPYSTIEMFKEKISKVTTASLPIGPIQPSEIFDVMQKAAINLNIDGGTAFPSTTATIEDGARQIVKADTELNESIKKMQLSAMPIAPEKVDRALEGDYAVSTYTTNNQEQRRTMMRKKRYEQLWTRHIRHYILMSKPISDELKKIFKNMDIEEILKRIKFKLPDIANSKIEAQLEDYEKHSNLADAMAEDLISDTMMRDMFQGQYLGRSTDGLREIIAGHIKIEYARERGILPELIDITNKDNEHIADAIKNKLSNIISVYGNVFEAIVKGEIDADKKIGKQVDKLNEGGAPAPATPPPADTGGGGDDPFATQDDPFAEGGGEEEEGGDGTPEEDAATPETPEEAEEQQDTPPEGE